MEQAKGFDMSKMSMASKILLGGGVLLLIDSFLSWQRVCVDLGGFEDVVGVDTCVSANAWGGTAGWAGTLMGILLIALLVWEGLQLAGTNMNVGMPAAKISAYLGFGVLLFAALKFLLIITNEIALFAFVGLVLAVVVGYGAWMRFQEPAGAMPPAASGMGDDGGFTA